MKDLTDDERKSVESLKARVAAVMGQEPSELLRFAALSELLVNSLPEQHCSVHCVSSLLDGVSQALSAGPCNHVKVSASPAARVH